MSLEFLRIRIPVLVVLITGTVLIFEYFFAYPTLKTLSSEFQKLGVLIFSMAMIMGLVGVTLNGMRKIMKRAPGEWYLNLWLLIVLYIWVIVGVIITPTHSFYTWLFNTFITSLYQAMLALPAFSLFVAIYRAYRIRLNIDSLLLISSLLVVMLTGVPIGEAIFTGAVDLRKWIIEIPVAAAERGLVIVMALGVVGICLRTILGMERTWLGILRIPALGRRGGDER
ncbi:MAG: hypothetical protein QXH67_04630 [Candidatus Bathyarchaeia archaeon]